MKKIILRPVWFIWKKIVRVYNLTENDGTAIIVIGFARSGTSLLGQIVAACGVHFGDGADLKKSDFRNPKGFYEHNGIFSLSRSFLREAGFESDLPDLTRGFRANGFFFKIMRAFTRFNMIRTLKRLSQGQSLWGFKNFPLFFYFWKGYLKKYKTIGIYRNPVSVAISYEKAWPAARFTFDQIIRFWTISNRDLLYHMISTESLLICYEDLFDVEKREVIFDKIVKFIGSGDVEMLKNIVSKELNRSSASSDKMHVAYPYSSETLDTLKSLEASKI